MFKYFKLHEVKKMKSMNRLSAISQGVIVTKADSLNREYDIFLSHCYSDAQNLSSEFDDVVSLFQSLGLSVYIDWKNDDNLREDAITADNADTLRKRLKNSRCLLYLTSENSPDSKWMPWELGYMDGLSKKVCVFPLLISNETFMGQEYLGLYPQIGYVKPPIFTLLSIDYQCLWVRENHKLMHFDSWLDV